MRFQEHALLALVLTGCGIGTLEDDDMRLRTNNTDSGAASALDDDADGDGGGDSPLAGVGITDANLEDCVRSHLSLAEGEITGELASELNHLDCPTAGIETIDGLEHFTGLQSISLWENNISDISPLADLTDIEWLELGANEIDDLSPLAELTGLTRLGLSSNEIDNIDDLAQLTAMQWLHLDGNDITNADALSEMNDLTWLTIEHNDIEDDSVLDAIEDGGADVYAQNQGSMGPEGPPAPTPTSVVAPRLSIDDGVLLSRQDESGALKLDFASRDAIYPLQLELPGQLAIDGTSVVLRSMESSTLVGTIDNGIVTLCAEQTASACHVALGAKTAPAEAYGGLGDAPVVYTLAMGVAPRPEVDDANYGEVDDGLIPYVLASPNQFDAGSCLFMSTTGAMELLVRQQLEQTEQDYEGDSDFSERFLMAAYQDLPSYWMPYWLTDTIYTYNYHGGSMLNRDYPFTAGYVRETSSGLTPCDSSDEGAYYSCSYNWFDYRPDDWEQQLLETPDVHRTIMYTDPARSSSSQWNVGLMDDEDVEKIKYLLRTRQAPVVVIYNHYLYWHADIVVGYDDTVETGGCPMVESSMDYFDEQGASSYTSKIQSHMDDIGDCTSQGAFYVRDSIYDGTSEEPMYSYSSGFTERYSQRVIQRSYNWVKYLGNHAYGIHRR